ncbi:hypothetical protein GQR58_009369 [Nymphon striatum]|nr:hypothetical protein GQR58_009369 [Nymphon striatum]
MRAAQEWRGSLARFTANKNSESHHRYHITEKRSSDGRFSVRSIRHVPKRWYEFGRSSLDFLNDSHVFFNVGAQIALPYSRCGRIMDLYTLLQDFFDAFTTNAPKRLKFTEEPPGIEKKNCHSDLILNNHQTGPMEHKNSVTDKNYLDELMSDVSADLFNEEMVEGESATSFDNSISEASLEKKCKNIECESVKNKNITDDIPAKDSSINCNELTVTKKLVDGEIFHKEQICLMQKECKVAPTTSQKLKKSSRHLDSTGGMKNVVEELVISTYGSNLDSFCSSPKLICTNSKLSTPSIINTPKRKFPGPAGLLPDIVRFFNFVYLKNFTLFHDQFLKFQTNLDSFCSSPKLICTNSKLSTPSIINTPKRKFPGPAGLLPDITKHERYYTGGCVNQLDFLTAAFSFILLQNFISVFELEEYFNSKAWIQMCSELKQNDDDSLSIIDKINLSKIKQQVKKRSAHQTLLRTISVGGSLKIRRINKSLFESVRAAFDRKEKGESAAFMEEVMKCLESLESLWRDFESGLGVTARLWSMYIDMMLILKRYIHAERAGLWQQHLQEVRNMLP